LLLKRLGHLRVGLRECLVLLLQFREQPHILNGDDRLIREGLEERDLLGREGIRLGSPIDEKDAQRDALAQ
jgi:hypothetical protein